MPVRPLTDAERSRLTGFPTELAEEELFSHFALSGPDRELLPSRAAPAVRLGFALSLCAVRYLGFCPDDLASAPESVLWYVGQQVGAPPEAIAQYGLRGQTRSDHLKLVHEHLGYRRPTEGDLEALSAWLLQRGRSSTTTRPCSSPWPPSG